MASSAPVSIHLFKKKKFPKSQFLIIIGVMTEKLSENQAPDSSVLS